jgi:hypothetical protein
MEMDLMEMCEMWAGLMCLIIASTNSLEVCKSLETSLNLLKNNSVIWS